MLSFISGLLPLNKVKDKISDIILSFLNTSRYEYLKERRVQLPDTVKQEPLDYIDQVYIKYMNDGEDKFSQLILANIDLKISTSPELDRELLDLSCQALERARSLELSSATLTPLGGGRPGRYDIWRNLSTLLRSLAHVAYRKYGDNRRDGAFLRAI